MTHSIQIAEGAELPLIEEHEPVEFSYPAAPGAALTLRVGGRVLEPFLRPGESVWRWRWNPEAAVGEHRVALEAGGTGERLELRLRVAPRKIDQDRYELLLEDMQRVARGLVYALGGAGSEGAALERADLAERGPVEEYYALFEARLAPFERAVRRIAARPRERLRDERADVPLGRAAELDDAALADAPGRALDPAPAGIAPELQEALRPGGGLLPQQVAQRQSGPSYDIYEHRLLRRLLTRLLRRAGWIGALARREAARPAFTAAAAARARRAAEIADACAAAAGRLRELRAAPFLADVRELESFRGPTPLLQRDASYREVYRMWQALRQSPVVALDSPLLDLPIAELPRLYEGWCALTVAHALLAIGGDVREQRLVDRRDQEAGDDIEFAVSIGEGAPLLVIERGDCTLALRYQPRYRPERRAAAQPPGRAAFASLDRHTRVPDLAIEVRRPDGGAVVLVLDAKYRLDPDGRHVPQDALADAYAYRGAIGLAGAPATLGALLLYPGQGAPERYPSGVGALPLLPGSTAELPATLLSWLGLPPLS